MTAESPSSYPGRCRPSRSIGSRRVAAVLGAVVLAVPLSIASAGGAEALGSGTALRAANATATTICAAISALPSAEVTVTLPGPAADLLLSRTKSYPGPCAKYGTASALGNGTVRTYVQRQSAQPLAVGVVFGAAMLDNLPTDPTDGHHCYDVDGNGDIDPMTECAGGHERPLDLVAQRDV